MDKAKEELLAALQELDLQEGKEEIVHAVEAITEEAKKKEPSRFTIKALFDVFSKGMELVSKTDKAMLAIERWKSYIEPILSNPPT